MLVHTSLRNKKGVVIKWLQQLFENEYFSWPVQRMSNNELLELFKEMNPNHCNLFSAVRFFSLQMNAICDDGMFKNILRIETHHPIYQVAYDFVTTDILSVGKNNRSNYDSDECKYFYKV